jgi:hypothetical protein
MTARAASSTCDGLVDLADDPEAATVVTVTREDIDRGSIGLLSIGTHAACLTGQPRKTPAL